MQRTALIVAYHFPPSTGSSGVQRALSLARYLPDHGWTPIVLTVNVRAYRSYDGNAHANLNQATNVHRAFALDSAQHLSVKGMYPDFFAWPDPWISWWPAAVVSGLNLIRKHQPSVIWSTYPIATAHLIAHTLHGLSGVPWVADFRDPMADKNYPRSRRRRKIYRWIERRTLIKANKSILTTPGARDMYLNRYPYIMGNKLNVIQNGYDETAFARAAEYLPDSSNSEKMVILHSGVIYPSERDPSSLFKALAQLMKAGFFRERDIEIRLRATGHDDYLHTLIESYGIQGVVKLAPPIPYEMALSEMLSADGLLLLQSRGCNDQIPAKVYEYIKARRPILALTDVKGDTAKLLSEVGVKTIVSLDSVVDIHNCLQVFVDSLADENVPVPQHIVDSYSRKEQVGKLAVIFNQLSRGF